LWTNTVWFTTDFASAELSASKGSVEVPALPVSAGSLSTYQTQPERLIVTVPWVVCAPPESLSVTV
jgi:hypothetical protein